MNGWWLGALLLVTSGAHDYEREIKRQRKELNQLRERVEVEQRDLSLLKLKKSATMEELERLSGSIAMTSQYLKKLEGMEVELMQGATEAQQNLTRIQSRMRQRNEVLAKRVRLLFMAGKPEDLLMSAGPESEESDFFRRAYFVKRLVRYDRRLVNESRRDMGLKQRSLEKLQGRLQELNTFQNTKEKEMTRFTHAKLDQEKTLQTLQKSEMAKAIALKQLEENAQLLDKILVTLEKRRKEELARGKKKAPVLETGTRYCQPAEGTVVSGYGLQFHSTLGITTRNLGIEINAKVGTPVHAAVSGEVAMITPIPGYGLGIILDNGSGIYTLYANLSSVRVNVGDKVKTCQDLASVATQPGKVYFEVRKGTATLDPVLWLKGEVK